ncbi:hypothetical protein BG011_005573 [Mortierella polycephala]|uniref:Uncharacterized protein n=1 Tax=Mortierella polycephala TaxID=41804 RepID=A0A9P6U141_9FUNG|nr:hypothetical protein BG011_005573 [Mortierella polycephala]
MAGVSGVEHPNTKAAVVANNNGTEDEATAPTPTGEIAKGAGKSPAAPAGPSTPEEDKADSVLTCMNGCGQAVECMNACLSTGYNVPTGSSSSFPTLMSSTSAPALISTTTTATGASPTAGSSVQRSSASHVSFQMMGAMTVIVMAVAFASL